MGHGFRIHDLVVYQKRKHSSRPSPRAHDVRPAACGDDYDYVIDKYWLVTAIGESGHLLLRTPGGKLHEIASNDPCLRRPKWHERLWLHVFGRDRLRALHPPTA